MLGLIVGESSLPKFLINKLLKKEVEFLILDVTKSNIYKNYKNSHSLKITQLGKAISILKRNNCKSVIFIGKVKRPEISLLKFDRKALFYIRRLFLAFKKGDGNILKEVIKIFKENKINVINSMKFTPELIFKDKAINKIKINNSDKSSISKGVSVIKSLSKFDIGQSVVINNGYVLAIEGPEGTDEAIKRSLYLSKKYNLKNKSILVKFPKINQDLRVDLPTIGIETIKNCIKANIKGIAVKRSQNIILNKDKIINLTKKNNFFIISL
ncbi:MAG: LpxI family protein [Candidatus Fonsibacter sp.]|nr:LpxI family protein [Candidatus Fonsibacter sp.]